jgi:hypothetical protein
MTLEDVGGLPAPGKMNGGVPGDGEDDGGAPVTKGADAVARRVVVAAAEDSGAATAADESGGAPPPPGGVKKTMSLTDPAGAPDGEGRGIVDTPGSVSSEGT